MTPELVPIDRLRPHPRNYRVHPEDQLAHLEESLREHGFYRPVVVARDFTILAGHGITLAARRIGYQLAPVVRLDLDPDDARSLKVLAGDNEVGRLAEVDDRALTEMLREVKDGDLDGLLGTGYDADMLANLVMVTRPEGEIADKDGAAEWVGMPDFEPEPAGVRLMFNFDSEADRDELVKHLGVRLLKGGRSTWWPPRAQSDLSSLRYVDGSS